MSDNVIQFGEMAFKLRGKRYPPGHYLHDGKDDRCKHLHVELDDNGDIVLCTDCKKQVSAYWALRIITEQWEEQNKKLAKEKTRLWEETQKSLHLVAARRVEEAWRTRSMLPACPHCHRGISPRDNFGSSRVNAEMEQRRRQNEAAKP